MNSTTWEETNGYEATRIYGENAVAAVSTVIRLQDGACMAGLKGKSGPPGNMNAFKHGLTAIRSGRGKNSDRSTRRVGGRSPKSVSKERVFPGKFLAVSQRYWQSNSRSALRPRIAS